MPQYDGRYDRELKMFTDAMKTKLAANQHKGKWEGVNLEELLQRIVGEVDELRQAIKGGNAIEIMLEAADIANFAMMAADVAVRQAVAPAPPYPGPRVTSLDRSADMSDPQNQRAWNSLLGVTETQEEKLDRLVPRTVAVDQYGGKTTQIGNFQIVDAERPD